MTESNLQISAPAGITDSEREELQREYANDMDMPEPAPERPIRLQNGQYVLAQHLRVEDGKGILCQVIGGFKAYLPVGNLLGTDEEARNRRLDAFREDVDDTYNFAKVVHTGSYFQRRTGKKRFKTVLLEVTEQEFEEKKERAQRQVDAVPAGSIHFVTVIRPAYSRGKRNEVCGLKVEFPSVPGLEALLHVSEMTGDALERVKDAQAGLILRVKVVRSSAVFGLPAVMVSETQAQDA